MIEDMQEAAIRQLLGAELIETLIELNNGSDTESFKKVAKSIYGGNNSKSISSKKIRHQLIDALSLQKAKELCVKLNINSKRDYYSSLKSYRLGDNKAKDSKFYDFFGIVEDETSPVIEKDTKTLVECKYALFDYQRAVVERCQKALSQGPRKSLIHMPTGSGKTRTAMHIIARHLINRSSTIVCWLASSKELLEQAAEEAERSWQLLGDRPIEIIRFWGDRSVELNDLNDGILIAGFAKMRAAYSRNQNEIISLGDRARLTIVDEAHQSIAPSYRSVIEALYTKKPENALLGLTATPGRTWNKIDVDQKLSDFFGGEKISLSVQGYSNPVTYLISEGYLANPNFTRLYFDQNINLSVEDLDNINEKEELSESTLTDISVNSARNFMILSELKKLVSKHKRIILFGASVHHCKVLAGVLSANGIEAKVVTAETPQNQRDRIINQYRSNYPEPIILCNYGVLTTGFDAPKTSAAVIARPTKSLVLYSQMVGRAIRGTRAGGNKTAEIVTVVDTTLPGFGNLAEAFENWEDVWNEQE